MQTFVLFTMVEWQQTVMERYRQDVTDKMKNDSLTLLGPARDTNRAKGGKRWRNWLPLPLGSLEEDCVK